MPIPEPERRGEGMWTMIENKDCASGSWSNHEKQNPS